MRGRVGSKVSGTSTFPHSWQHSGQDQSTIGVGIALVGQIMCLGHVWGPLALAVFMRSLIGALFGSQCNPLPPGRLPMHPSGLEIKNVAGWTGGNHNSMGTGGCPFCCVGVAFSGHARADEFSLACNFE